jgi:hypothetical protein
MEGRLPSGCDSSRAGLYRAPTRGRRASSGIGGIRFDKVVVESQFVAKDARRERHRNQRSRAQTPRLLRGCRTAEAVRWRQSRLGPSSVRKRHQAGRAGIRHRPRECWSFASTRLVTNYSLPTKRVTPAGELAFQAWLRADPIKAFKHVFSSAGGAIGFRWSHGSKIAHPHGDHSWCAVQCRNQRDAKTRGD